MNSHKPQQSDVLGPVPHLRKYRGGGTAERVIGRTPEGEPATGPAVPAQKWIDPGGNVVFLSVRSCRNQDADDPQRYESYITRKKLRQGWAPYWAFESPAKREEEIAARKADQGKRSEQYRKAWATQNETEALKSTQAMTAALQGVMAEVARQTKAK